MKSSKALEARTAKRDEPQPSSGNNTTREKILDAAEKLFGERTFDTVSLRDITQEADVTLALVSYHFGTKDRLLAEVVGRRAHILGDKRRARLDALKKKGSLTTESIFDAFMRPLFEQMSSGEQGWESYVLILPQLGQSNRWLNLLHDNFDETAELFLSELRLIHPELKKPVLLRGFTIALAAMLQTLSRNRRVDVLSGGAVAAADLNTAYKILLKFVTKGFEGLTTK